MRIKSLISLATVALLVTACSDENEGLVSPSAKGMLRASVEGSYSSTRAGFNSSGAFYWSVKDQLGVTTIDNGTETTAFSSLTLNTGGGTANATFSGTIKGTIGNYAVYPCNDNHKVSGNNLTYNFPASYKYTQVDDDYFTTTQGAGNSFNPAMWGRISNGSVYMKHLGGVFCIKVPKMPVAEGTLSLIADKKIAGDFTVNLSEANPVIATADATADTEKTVSIAFSNATENQPGVFYVPVPTGTYNVRVKILASAEEKMNVVAGTYTIARCDLKKLEFSSTKVDVVVPTAVESLSAATEALKSNDSSTTTTAVSVSNEITGDSNTITIPTVAASGSGSGEESSDESGDKATTETTKSVSLENVASGASLTVSDAKTSETETTTETSVSNFTLSIPNNEAEGFTPLTVEIAMPSTTVTLAGNAGAATYGTVTASTADNTLVIDKDVTVKKVIVKKGNIRVNKGAKLVEITKDASFSGGKVTIYKEEGAELPESLSTESFEVVSEEGMTEVLKNGGTYTLFKDMEGDFVVSATNAVIINLNGHKITNKSGDTFTVNIGSSLTIQGKGTVDNISHGKTSIYNNGTVVLNGGTYTRSKENGKDKEESGGNSYYNILNHGTMTINTGVTVKQGGHFSSTIANGYFGYSKSTDPRTGYKEGTNAANPKLTINGGTFSGGLNTVKNDDGATLEITGGAFSNVSQNVVVNNHVASISGGTFTCNEVDTLYAVNNRGWGDESLNWGKMTITGGTFTGKVGSFNKKGNTADLTITAGTFSDPSALQYLGDNANVNIKLDKDYTVSHSLGVAKGKTVTMDLNQKTLTSTYTAASASYVEGTETIQNGSIDSQKGFWVQNGGNLTFDNVKVTEHGHTALTAQGTNTYLTVKNKSVITGKYFGCSTNATNSAAGQTPTYGANATITLSDSEFTAEETGFMNNVPASVTMTNCTFSGTCHGALLRGGEYTITNSTFTLNAEKDKDTYKDGSWAANSDTWADGNRCTYAAITMGNDPKSSSYQYYTKVDMKKVTAKVTGTHANDYTAVYVAANSGKDLGVTWTYDAGCVFGESGQTSIAYKESSKSNITVNGAALAE